MAINLLSRVGQKGHPPGLIGLRILIWIDMEGANFQFNIVVPDIDVPKLYPYEIPGQRKNLLFIEKVTTMQNPLNGLNWQRMAC